MISAQPDKKSTLYPPLEASASQWDAIALYAAIAVVNRRAQWREYRARNRAALNKKAREGMRKLRAIRRAERA